MNEIKHIHLGRQAFTIALDAHAELRKYLDAIKKRADKEVVEEIELRMAELLTERNIDEKKVVLLTDVEYLKENLGQPTDFSDDETEEKSEAEAATGSDKRLFRDPEDVWLGGVASGIAAYFGAPVWAIRLAFVIVTLFWGSGLIVYILLWLLVPEAKTPSDRLQMRGKPVTVETIKEFVNDESVKESARAMGDKAAKVATQVGVQTGTVAGTIIRRIGRIFLLLMGLGLVLSALFSLLWLIIGTVMLGVNPAGVTAGVALFPVGTRELVALVSLSAVVAIILLFVLFSGMALLRRKWMLPGWVVATMVTLCFVGTGLGTALGLDAVPRVRDRYEAARYDNSQDLQPFTKVTITGDGARNAVVQYMPSEEYRMHVHAFGMPNIKDIKVTQTADGTFDVHIPELVNKSECSWFCIYEQEAVITIFAPRVDQLDLSDDAQYRSYIPIPYAENSALPAEQID